MKEIVINENEAGQRLDKFLGKLLKEAPASFYYKMLRKKNIVLNGKKATGNEKLTAGDSVNYSFRMRLLKNLQENNRRKIRLFPFRIFH